jgi:tetratricopeptide (TPR) repeat protein
LKKSILTFFVFSFKYLGLFAQETTPIAKADTKVPGEKVIIEIKAETKATNKSLIPLFGTGEKTTKEKKEDMVFIDMCRKNFPNLVEASKFFTDRGWEYLAENELDTAIHRFNLSYILNPKNVDSYWGLGVICFQKGEFDNASNILKKGIEIDSTNAALMVDLATVEISCFEKNKHQDDLILAHNHLGHAIEIDPSNIAAWQKRSETEYYLENYENAWECIHSARLLDITKIDLLFVGKLSEKMKDPQNVFKF